MSEIDKIDDKFFKKIFESPKNAKDFLLTILPQNIKEYLDFSKLHVDRTNYVSEEFQEGYADIVIKVKIKDSKGKRIPADIYFIIEHKKESRKKILLQILKYMYFVWEEDQRNKKPLRVIIPAVFYHGKKKWKVSRTFSDQFDVNENIKHYLLNYRYILFDTNDWDLEDKANEKLKENVFLFSALTLMKAAFDNDPKTIREILKYWHENGFTRQRDNIIYFLVYISHTQHLNMKQLDKMLRESKINGGEIMQTLAQQLKEEGIKIGEERGIKVGEKRGIKVGEKRGIKVGEERGIKVGEKIGEERGKTAKAIETAKNLLEMGIAKEMIARATGLKIKEVEDLASQSN